MKHLVWASLIACAAACSGPSTPPEEEVTATWTSGDDEPLEGEEEALEEAEHD